MHPQYMVRCGQKRLIPPRELARTNQTLLEWWYRMENNPLLSDRRTEQLRDAFNKLTSAAARKRQAELTDGGESEMAVEARKAVVERNVLHVAHAVARSRVRLALAAPRAGTAAAVALFEVAEDCRSEKKPPNNPEVLIGRFAEVVTIGFELIEVVAASDSHDVLTEYSKCVFDETIVVVYLYI